MGALTLYELEDNLLALLDTAEMVEDPEQQERIGQEIVAAYMAAVEKRDRVAQFLAHCEHQQANIDAERKRLGDLKTSYARAQERVEGYVARVIQDRGPDAKGKYPKLEGKTSVFSLRGSPPSVNITDEVAVPWDFKTVTITVSGKAWEALTDSEGCFNETGEDLTGKELDDRVAAFLLDVKKSDWAIDKAGVKRAINGGGSVPGADLAIGKFNLQRK